MQDHLDDDRVRVVEGDENPARYAEAHIPGAVGFDWRQDLQDPVRRDFLDAQAFGDLLGSRGISNDRTIVLYGDRNNWFAAYTYWYLKYYGHHDVKLMNGPREKWIAEGRPATPDVPSLRTERFTAGTGDPAIRAYRQEVYAALDGSARLVDVRSPQEYSGSSSRCRDTNRRALSAGPHPRCEICPVGAGRARRRHIQERRRAA